MDQANRFLGKALAFVLAAVFTAALIACSDSGDSAPGPATSSIGGNITVFAAASLTDAFTELATEFRKANRGVGDVTFNFAGSSALRAQLEQGARADVFASADLAQMEAARKSGVVVEGAAIFARNSLVVITPRDNPAGVNAPADLKKSGLKLVLAAPEVPAGSYARQMLRKMDADPAYGAGFSDAVLRNLVSNESNVKQVVAKVQLGEADAGVVYGTDITASVAPDLNRIEVPANLNVIAEYPIAVTRDAGNPGTAEAFVSFLQSSDGQAVLKKYGFQGR